MPVPSSRSEPHRPPFGPALLLCILLLAVMGWLRLYVFRERYIPLAYELPLLICIWTRRRSILWGMAAVLLAMSTIKVFWVLPVEAYPLHPHWTVWLMQFATILLMAAAVHTVLVVRDRLEARQRELETVNAELEASNEELAARDEEISTQNEELQSQAEELEQQAEELRTHAEQLQRVNDELNRRETMLQTLLRATSTVAGHDAVLEAVCRATLRLLAPESAGVAVLERAGDDWVLRGSATEEGSPPLRRCGPYAQSFAALVLERGQTAYLEDVRRRPDLQTLQTADGPPLCALLATPLYIRGQAVGAVEAYSFAPRQWTVEQFRLLEWAAHQCALVLETVRLRRELEARQCEAEEASRRKTRFLAAVSHDIRTPANAITLLAELISRVAESPGGAAQLPELTRDLKANSRALVELVTDVLDVARFDSGQQEITLGDFPLEAALASQIRQFQPLAQAKGLLLELSLAPPAAGLILRTDRMKFARIFANLIGNALKFTDHGGVRVLAEPAPDGGVNVAVVDSGVGISPEHQQHIFDEFFQLRNPERDRNKGTGLGLTIGKRLVDALGCTIEVESCVGQGSTFRVHVPPALLVAEPRTAGILPATSALPASSVLPARGTLPATSPAAPPTSVSDAVQTDLGGVTILLVEDHDVTRRATAELLAGAGARVMQVPDGRAALHALAQCEPEFLLLDLMLPDMDGREVLRALRTRRPPSLHCVLAITGDVTPTRREEVLRLGADGLVYKPVKPEELIRLLRQFAGNVPRAAQFACRA